MGQFQISIAVMLSRRTANPKSLQYKKAETMSTAWVRSLATGVLSLAVPRHDSTSLLSPNVGALITRIGFWDPLYYTHNKEPPQ